MTVSRYGRRFWSVTDAAGALVCVCVYRKGALEVARRLSGALVVAPPEPSPVHECAAMAVRLDVGEACDECGTQRIA